MVVRFSSASLFWAAGYAQRRYMAFTKRIIMIRNILWLIFIMFSISIVAQERDVPSQYTVKNYIDINYKNRWVNQQNYVVGIIQENRLWEKPFKNTSEVDSLISKMMRKWSFETGIKDSIYLRFDAYPLICLTSISDYSSWTWNYVFKKYMAPNFIKDVKYMSSTAQSESINLINVPSYMNLISTTLSIDLEENVWRDLYQSFHIVSRLIDSALTRNDFDNSLEMDFKQIQSSLKKSQSRFELLNAIYEDNLDNAFVQLYTAFSDGLISKTDLVRPATMLTYKYNNLHQTEQALATLNLLSKSTIDEELGRDSLNALYRLVDSIKGDSLFQIIQKPNNSSSFTTSSELFKLSGKYLDLTNSKTVDISKLNNKYILLDFWFTSCGPCRKEIPRLKRFYAKNKHNQEFVFVSVVSDAVNKVGTTKKDIQKFIKENNIDYIVLYDTPQNSLTRKFNVKGFPTKYLLNKDGNILERTPGEKMSSLDYASAFLKELSEK